MNYIFSAAPTFEIYGRKFFEVRNGGDVVAYSEKVFEIPEEVSFPGPKKPVIFEKADIRGGEFRGGVFCGGVFCSGEFWGGEFLGGEFWGGEFWGGEFRGGEFRGGEFCGGEFRGGVFMGGVFMGGVFMGGVFWGGVFMGGEFRGGTIFISLLQIQGTRHFCYATPAEDGKSILWGIGCKTLSAEDWIKSYKDIAQSEAYDEDEIVEYASYFNLFLSRYHPEIKFEL